MGWLIFWLVVYLVVIGIFSFRHIRAGNIEGYLINNRNTGTVSLVFTTLATFVGGGTSIGLMGMGYEAGFTAVAVGLAYVIGFFILAGFAAKINRTGRILTIYSFPEFLNKSYLGDNSDPLITRLFSSLISGVNVFVFFFLLAAQFVGMATLIRFSFDIGFIYAAIISCVIVIVYTALAGLSGVIITDSIQFIAIILMIVVIFVPGIWSDTESLSRLKELPATMLDGSQYGIAFLIALPLFIAPSVLVRMDLWQRMLAARSERVARKTSIISALGMLPFYIIFPLVGMAVKLTIDHEVTPKDVAYVFLDNHTQGAAIGFAVVGLLSALMSSADSFLNLIALTSVKDFLGWKKKGSVMSKNELQKKVRNSVFIFGFIALIMALALPKIVDLMVVGIGTIVIFVPVTLLALIRKEVQSFRLAALISILSGFIVNLAFFVYGLSCPESFDLKSSFIPAFIISIVVLPLVQVFVRRNQKRKMDSQNSI